MLTTKRILLILAAGLALCLPGIAEAACTDQTLRAQLDADDRTIELVGDCQFSQPLALPSGTRLTGYGTITASGPLEAVLLLHGASDVVIRDITVDAAGQGHGVSGTGVEAIRLDNVTVRNGRTHNVRFEAAKDVRLSYVRLLDGWGDGLATRQPCEDVTIVGGLSRGNGHNPNGNGQGYDLSGCKDVRLLAARTEGNDGAGVVVKTTAYGAQGKWLPRNIQIVALSAQRNTGAGVEVTSKSEYGYASGVTVLGGVLDGNREGLTWDGLGGLVVAPQVLRSQLTGLRVAARGRDLEVQGGLYAGNGTLAPAYGVYLAGASTSAVVSLALPGWQDLIIAGSEVESGSQRGGGYLHDSAQETQLTSRARH